MKTNKLGLKRLLMLVTLMTLAVGTCAYSIFIIVQQMIHEHHSHDFNAPWIFYVKLLVGVLIISILRFIGEITVPLESTNPVCEQV